MEEKIGWERGARPWGKRGEAGKKKAVVQELSEMT